MNFLKKIFGRSSKAIPQHYLKATSQHHLKAKPRHHLNAPGDFYTEKDACILCGAPEVEAMGLMGHSDEGCYFVRQPQTEEEIGYAINAIAVSCVSAVRYGGTDQNIIKRIHENGAASECDHELNA